MLDDEFNCMVKAFEIDANESIDLNLPPSSGSDYLRRVQLEYQQCPTVVVADVDTSRFLSKQTVTFSECNGFLPAPKGFAPSLKWQRQQVAKFSDLRQKLSMHRMALKNENVKPVRIPLLSDESGWCELCLGSRACSELSHCFSNEESAVKKSRQSSNKTDGSKLSKTGNEDGTPPLLSILCSMSQPVVQQVLNYHIKWLEIAGFSNHKGCWFYALLANLEKPLVPGVCSSLRSLARACAKLRCVLNNKDHPHLVPLNLLICLVAHYFDQKDLADSPE